jgi:UDP-N-acetyl-D-glucosamine dehydrogenase
MRGVALMQDERSDLVVVGLGYVGLPLAQEAVRSGLSVVGLDTDPVRVATLADGRSPITDLDDQELADMLAAGFRVTSDPACLARTGVVVVCVPTPLREDGTPELSAVRDAMTAVGDRLQPGTLVVLESTTYPGTTEQVVAPLLEARSGLVPGRDVALAYSPERIDPGNALYGVRSTPKVVGGLTPACGEAAAVFYGKLVDEVVPVRGTREAEMAKLLENTYRHVNIALVNEMAVFCHELDIDLWDVIDAAATKPFGFAAFRPGPGVGGHCIPVDPSYLSWTVRRLGYPFRFVELAQEINDRMPAYVVTRITRALNDRSRAVRGSRVLLLGVTYKADVADARETPAVPLARRLLELGADVHWHDPFVDEFAPAGEPLPRVPDPVVDARSSDVVVLLQAHAGYDLEALAAAAPLLFDTRGVVTGEGVERL